MVKLEDIFEDVVAAPNAAANTGNGGEVAAPTNNNDDADIVDGNSGITTDDVLGKDCDHKNNGYLGPGCFHTPMRVTAKGKKANNKKKKKNKNPYEKGMAIIADSDKDVPKDVLSNVEKLDVDDVKKILKTSFQTNIEDDNQLVCIVYCPLDQKLMLKFIDDKGKNAYVHLEVRDGKVVAQDLRIYSTIELERAYKTLKKSDTANQKIDIRDIELKIVWRP